MTDEAGLPENVVSLAKFKEKKLEEEKNKLLLQGEEPYLELDRSSLDSINEMCAETINELFDFLENNFELFLDKKDNMIELIMFLESYKSLVMKACDKWHPFQDMANKIFNGVKLEQTDDGSGYKYVFENLEKI